MTEEKMLESEPRRIQLLKGVIYFLLGAVLFIPLFYSGKFLFPFITPKTIFFRIFIELALFFYLILIIYKPEYRPRLNKLTGAILIYLLIITLASLWGVNLYRSFWGNIERGEGLITLYHLAIFFILLTSFFKTKKAWLRFFDLSILVGFLISLYALAQKLGLPFVVHSGTYRLDSTIGNASFLAAYLIFIIFLILYCWPTKLSSGYKFSWSAFYLIVFLLALYILFSTQTRGAVLAAFGGFLLLAILLVIFSRSKRLKLGLLVFLIILLSCPLLIWLNKDQAWVKNQPTLNRLVSISPEDVTTQSRFLTWQASWQAWQDRFILGYGYENYNLAFNKYFPVLIFKDEGSRLWWDRAHNIIFDQAVTGGILGLLSYLAILGLALWLLWFRIKGWPRIVLTSLLAAYFVQNLFVFDTHSSYIMFFSVLALISFLSEPAKREPIQGQSDEKRSLKPTKLTFSSILTIVCLILIFIFMIHFFNLKPIWANHYCALALSYAYHDMYRESMTTFQKALSYQTYQNPEIRRHLARTVISALSSQQLTKEEMAQYFDYAILEIKKNIQRAPLDAYDHLYLMTLYNASYYFDQSRLDLVIEEGEKTLALSPSRPQIYFEMGQACMNLKKFDQGIDYFKKGVALADHVVEAHWNLALAYLYAGQEDLAEEEFKIAEQRSSRAENLLRLAQLYAKKKDYQKVVEIYEELVYSPEITQQIRQPRAQDFASLAAAYKEIGQYRKAAEAVMKAVEMDPERYAQEAEIFLELLREARINVGG